MRDLPGQIGTQQSFLSFQWLMQYNFGSGGAQLLEFADRSVHGHQLVPGQPDGQLLDAVLNYFTNRNLLWVEGTYYLL